MGKKAIVWTTQAGLSRAAGLSAKTISKRVKEGVIKRHPQGIDLNASLAILRKRKTLDKNPKSPQVAPAPRRRAKKLPNINLAPCTFDEARTLTEYYKAQAAELDLKKKTGEQISRDEIAGIIIPVVKAIRTQFLSLPQQVAPQLIGIENPATIQELLESEIRKVLLYLSRMEDIESNLKN